MKYTVETTANGVRETLEIEGNEYTKEWTRDGGCLCCAQKDFAEQLEGDGFPDYVIEKADEAFDGYISSIVEDIREYLQ